MSPVTWENTVRSAGKWSSVTLKLQHLLVNKKYESLSAYS